MKFTARWIKTTSLSKLTLKLSFMLALVVFLVALMSPQVNAYKPSTDLIAHETPEQLEGIGIDEKLGEVISGDLQFTDENGEQVTLAKYFNGTKPVLLTMVYYECPSLCNFHLNGLLATFKKMELSVGKDFRFVAVSMDHREGHKLASEKKTNYLKEYGREGAESDWHFLTGSEDQIKKLANEIGFKFRWDEKQKQYAHAAAAYITTPTGKLSRYLYGIEFIPQTLRFSLLEASDGKIGSIVDQIILFCFQFDPSKNKYTLYAYNIMRLAAALAVAGLMLWLIPLWLKEKRQPGSAA